MNPDTRYHSPVSWAELLLLLGSFAVTRARELHGSRREMDRQLADLLKERP